MTMTKIMISVGTPEPGKGAPVAEAPSVEDQVKHALDCILSGYNSDVEWLLVNKLYKELKVQKKLTPRGQNIVKMIEPVLAKFGYHRVSSEG